jgi:5-methylcytosine-specific restriction endonuclease McrA
MRFQIFQRDQFTCRYCGRKAPDVQLEVDHAIAWKEGGSSNPANLVTACFDCNRGKGARSVVP